RGGDRGGPVLFAGYVVVHVPAVLVADPGGDVIAPVVEHVAEHHARALGHEVPHVRLPHAPGAPGNQRDLAIQPAHSASRVLEITARPTASLLQPNACLVSLTAGRRPGTDPPGVRPKAAEGCRRRRKIPDRASAREGGRGSVIMRRWNPPERARLAAVPGRPPPIPGRP